MEERPTASESLHRYDITIAGKQFNIASRYGEAHIRRMERLIQDTILEMGENAEGKGMLTVALLAALNLADRVISAESEHDQAQRRFDSRLGEMLGVLERTLGAPRGTAA